MRFRNAAALLLALLGGCVADASVGYTAQPVYAPAPAPEPAPVEEQPAPAADVQVEATVEAPEQPELVEVEANPGVQVVYDVDVPTFYADNFYWRYDGGVWLRSSVHTGGFVVYNDPPVTIRHIERPTMYAHYRPASYVPRAQRPGYVPPRHTTTVRDPGYRAPATGYRQPTTTTRPGYTPSAPVRQQPTYTGTPQGTIHQQPGQTYHQPAATTVRPTPYTPPAGQTYHQPPGTGVRPNAGYNAPPRPTTTPTTTRPATTQPTYHQPAATKVPPAKTDDKKKKY